MNTSKKLEPRIATYCIYNLQNGQRLHRWGDDRWAIGNGPIRYIDHSQAMDILSKHHRAANNT